MTATAPAYVIFEAVTAKPGDIMAMRCQGRRCRRVLTAGEQVRCVVHERRWIRNPAAADAQAWLCDACVSALGARARPAAPRRTTPRRPIQIATRRPLEPW